MRHLAVTAAVLLLPACSIADAFTEKLARETGQRTAPATTQSTAPETTQSIAPVAPSDPVDRAEKLIRNGESLVMEGRDLIADGQARISKGERMAARGRRLKEEAKAGHIDRSGIIMD